MQRETDRTWRDDFHAATFKRPAQAGKPASAGASKVMHHAKWLAINVALIAVTAYLYRYHIIPGLQQRYSGGDGGQVEEPMVSSASRIEQSSETPSQERIRLARQRVLEASQPPPAAPRRPELDRFFKEYKAGNAKCVGNRVFWVTENAAGTKEITRDARLTCYMNED